jgi:hypothetical protein
MNLSSNYYHQISLLSTYYYNIIEESVAYFLYKIIWLLIMQQLAQSCFNFLKVFNSHLIHTTCVKLVLNDVI